MSRLSFLIEDSYSLQLSIFAMLVNKYLREKVHIRLSNHKLANPQNDYVWQDRYWPKVFLFCFLCFFFVFFFFGLCCVRACVFNIMAKVRVK